MRVLQHVGEITGSEEQKQQWGRHWVIKGLTAFEKSLAYCAGVYCFGNSITLADVVLVPQLYSARRFEVDLTAFPTCLRIEEALSQHPAFVAAHPNAQGDNPDRK